MQSYDLVVKEPRNISCFHSRTIDDTHDML